MPIENGDVTFNNLVSAVRLQYVTLPPSGRILAVIRGSSVLVLLGPGSKKLA
jgi:hypothetical protein